MPKYYTAKDLKERVTIQTPDNTRNAEGGITLNWGTVATVWASVEPISGSESVKAKSMLPELTHKVVIRYRDDVSPRERIVTENYGIVLNVVAVVNIGLRNEYLELQCKQSKPEANLPTIDENNQIVFC